MFKAKILNFRQGPRNFFTTMLKVCRHKKCKKMIGHDEFFIFWKFWLNDVITFFLSFLLRHSHALKFMKNFFKSTYYVFQLMTLFKIANQRFPLISSIQYGRLDHKNMAELTVKIKICVKQKTKHCFVLTLSRWWRIWPYFLRR